MYDIVFYMLLRLFSVLAIFVCFISDDCGLSMYSNDVCESCNFVSVLCVLECESKFFFFVFSTILEILCSRDDRDGHVVSMAETIGRELRSGGAL